MPAPEFCFLAIDWWPFCMTKAEWSGWVQAIFSVVAIVAAFAISEIQQCRQQKASFVQRREASAALTRACYLTCDEAVQTIGYIARRFEDGVGKRLRLRSERVAELLATFQTLLGKDVAPDVLREVLTIQRELSYTLIALIQSQSAQGTYDRWIKAGKRAETVSEALARLKSRHDIHQWLTSGDAERMLAQPLSFGEMEYSE